MQPNYIDEIQTNLGITSSQVEQNDFPDLVLNVLLRLFVRIQLPVRQK